MNKTLFSIIVPSHNNTSTLKETIRSIQEQSIKDWECLIIDDYSTDETEELIKETVKDDNHFFFHKNDGSTGANVCRNIGMNNSRGEYLVFLDGDDLLSYDCLANRKRFLEENPDTELLISPTTFFEHDICNPIGIFKCKPALSNEDLICSFLKHHILWTTTGPTWKKSFITKIGGWNENYPRLQDIELNIRALIHKPKTGFTTKEDSFLRKSLFTSKKKRSALIGFNLLLRDCYVKLMNSTEENLLIEKYSEAFERLIFIILDYCRLFKESYHEEWGAFFLDTLKEIVDDDTLKRVKKLISFK